MAGRKKSEKAPPKLVSVSFRLEPRTKFAAEILARAQHRSLAGTVEWAISKALASQEVSTGFGTGTLQQLVDKVWSPDDLERVIYLGAHAEHLLNHEESCLWTIVKSSPALFEIHGVDDQGRIRAFKIRKARIAFVRDLISERAQQLADNGQLVPISYDEINRASNGSLRSHEEEQEQLSAFLAASAPDVGQAGRFHLKQVGQSYCFTLVAENGECLLTSDLYDSKDAALNAMEAARKAADTYDFFRAAREASSSKSVNSDEFGKFS